MSTSNDTTARPSVPALADLFTRYLQRRTTAHEAGFAGTEGAAEVMPFEAVPVQPIDARFAWTESLAVMGFFRAGTDMRSLPVPADWTDLVATQEPATAMALALGNFPQALRSLNPLLQTPALASLQPAPTSARSLPALITWASQQKEFPRVLLALGVLRLGKQFDGAEELCKKYQTQVPADWRAAWENEIAALAWHNGDSQKAIRLWEGQGPSMPVLFNRGMAALFSDRPEEACTWLKDAVGQMPEESSWNHLGRLYLALAEMRS